jgi:hypothetical protein
MYRNSNPEHRAMLQDLAKPDGGVMFYNITDVMHFSIDGSTKIKYESPTLIAKTICLSGSESFTNTPLAFTVIYVVRGSITMIRKNKKNKSYRSDTLIYLDEDNNCRFVPNDDNEECVRLLVIENTPLPKTIPGTSNYVAAQDDARGRFTKVLESTIKKKDTYRCNLITGSGDVGCYYLYAYELKFILSHTQEYVFFNLLPQTFQIEIGTKRYTCSQYSLSIVRPQTRFNVLQSSGRYGTLFINYNDDKGLTITPPHQSLLIRSLTIGDNYRTMLRRDTMNEVQIRHNNKQHKERFENASIEMGEEHSSDEDASDSDEE